MTDEQIEKLKAENPEYAQLCEIIDGYDTFVYLYHLHFCKKLDDGNFKFNPELAERNADFMQRWPKKKEKIEQRLKKNSYFHSGRKSDEKDLRLGKRRYSDLVIYCQLEKDFSELDKNLVDLSQSDESDLKYYIEELKNKKESIEKEFEKKRKPKQKV